MRRRDFFTLIGCVAVAWPSTVRAQKRVPAVGILLFGGAADARDIGFVRELIRIGYVEGNNISSLAAKRLELLRDLVPGVHKVAYLWAPESPMT
ncbi:MAG: hypothetical protein WAK39_20220, partial [Pseudolabrys sp.]